jgi:uncharacterized damage-inducible protein DinB
MNRQLMLDVHAFQRGYLSLLVDDVSDRLMTTQFPGVPNHPAWQLGHLAWATDNFTELLGGTKILNEAWRLQYGRDSKPGADPGQYPSKEELVRIYDDRRAAFLDALDRTTPERFMSANPNPRLAGILPTTGHMVVFGMLTHESVHLGQLAVWRSAAGMVPALSKMS